MRGLFDDITVRKLCTEGLLLLVIDAIWRYFGFYRCVKCNRPLCTLCCTCKAGLRYAVSSPSDCLAKGGSTKQVPCHFSLFGYTKVVKMLFAAYKFQYAKQYQREIENLSLEYAELDPFGLFKKLMMFVQRNIGTIVMLPVPMTVKKFEERGFSPATELAIIFGRIIAAKSSKRVLLGDKFIEKIKETAPQSRKNRNARLLSILNSFSVNEAGVSELRRLTPALLIIVDDVYTTGATITEMYETLVRAKIPDLLPNLKIVSLSFAQSERVIR